MPGSSSERRGNGLVITVGVAAALALVGFYVCNREAPSPGAAAPVAAPAPGMVASPWPDLGAFLKRRLPGGGELSIPERGMEGRFLAFIEDPSAVVTKEQGALVRLRPAALRHERRDAPPRVPGAAGEHRVDPERIPRGRGEAAGWDGFALLDEGHPLRCI